MYKKGPGLIAPALSLPKTVRKKVKQEQKLAASSITSLLWRHKVCREHFDITLGERTKSINKSYTQIFLKFLFYFMIDKSKKNSFFLMNLFFSFFIIQVLENSDFSYLSLHDRLCYLDQLSWKEEIYANFHWDKTSKEIDLSLWTKPYYENKF